MTGDVLEVQIEPVARFGAVLRPIDVFGARIEVVEAFQARVETDMTSINQPRNAIEIVRGSTQTFRVVVTDPTEDYFDFTDASRVVFSVKESVGDAEALFRKEIGRGITFPDDNPRAGLIDITIDPRDTERLPFDEYLYDVWVIFPISPAPSPPAAQDVRYPLIRVTKFLILPRVTVFAP